MSGAQTSCPNPKINNKNSPVEPWFICAERLTSHTHTHTHGTQPSLFHQDPSFCSVARNIVFRQRWRLRLRRRRCHHHRPTFLLLFYFEIGKCYFVWRKSVVSLYSIVFHSDANWIRTKVIWCSFCVCLQTKKKFYSNDQNSTVRMNTVYDTVRSQHLLYVCVCVFVYGSGYARAWARTSLLDRKYGSFVQWIFVFFFFSFLFKYFRCSRHDGEAEDRYLSKQANSQHRWWFISVSVDSSF